MKIENNTKMQVYLHITDKCNIKCPWCYCRGTIEDITVEAFEEVCSRLPERVMLRFLGGEPTIHPNILELISIGRKYGHLVTMSSNGVKFADIEFCKEVNKRGPVIVCISMDAVSSEETKLKALQNLTDVGFKRVVVSATFSPDNLYMGKYLRDIADKFSSVKYIHYRTMVGVDNPLTMEQMKEVVIQSNPDWNTPLSIIRDGKQINGEKCCGGCELRLVKPDLQILLIDCARIGNCIIRGYIDHETFEVLEFFPELRRRNNL